MSEYRSTYITSKDGGNFLVFREKLRDVLEIKDSVKAFLEGIRPAKHEPVVKKESSTSSSSSLSVASSSPGLDEEEAKLFFLWLKQKLADDVSSLARQASSGGSYAEKLRFLWTAILAKFRLNTEHMMDAEAQRWNQARQLEDGESIGAYYDRLIRIKTEVNEIFLSSTGTVKITDDDVRGKLKYSLNAADTDKFDVVHKTMAASREKYTV